MIAKVSRGADGTGLARYLFGPGKENEHADQRVIAASDGLEVEHGRLLSRAEVLDLGHQLDAPQALFGTEVKDGHVWHLSLTNPAGDRSLSDAEWSKIAHDTMDRLGFTEAPGRAGCPWVAVGHGLSSAGNEHIHIAVSLVREDGSKASIWQDRVKLSEACSIFERDYGLTVVDGRNREGMPGVSRAEDELAARRGRAEPERDTLARSVRACSVASRDEGEFVRRLRAEGVIARPRYGKGGEREVVGYSVALKPAEAGQGPVWFGGGTLARDLRLPALRAAWEHSPAVDHQAVLEWGATPPSPGREAAVKGSPAWALAADRVEEVNRHLRSVPAAATARWSAVERQAAGVLGQLAVRFEPDRVGPLGSAASVVARASQQYHGDGLVAADGPELGGVAALARQTENHGRQGPQVGRLVSGLSETVQQAADAHAARGEQFTAAKLGQASSALASWGASIAAAGLAADRGIAKAIGADHQLEDDEFWRDPHCDQDRDRDDGYGR